jgi:hypothetical protein
MKKTTINLLHISLIANLKKFYGTTLGYLKALKLREQLKQSATDAAEKLTVRSALNPILWLCLIVTAPGLAATPFFPNGAPAWYIIIVLLPVIFACLGFSFLMIFDRDKLQSEEYQLRKRSLELIYEKGQEFPVNPTSIELITNPNYPQIPQNLGGDE